MININTQVMKEKTTHLSNFQSIVTRCPQAKDKRIINEY